MWANGDVYEGDWLDFLKHGYGTDTFGNGDSYTGQYRYGKPWGRGVYRWISGAIYEGEFIEGKKEGKGRWEKRQKVVTTDDEGNEKETETLTYYEGDYKNDMKHGYGEY